MKKFISDRLHPSESIVLAALAMIVGLTSAAGVWLFKWLIDVVHKTTLGNLRAAYQTPGGWIVMFLPMLGGLVVGLVLHYFIGEERYHGVAGIMESVAIAGGRLRYKRMPAKAVAAAISIGSGASVGPEDPSVQIGSNLGSMFGQMLHLSDERMRALVAAGAASGVAAAFNAPIAGVFFALEIILGEISGGALGVVVLSSVISSVFTQAVAGPEPAFHVPGYSFNSIWELPFYLILGLLAGPLAALYVRLLYLAQDFFHQWIKVPRWLKPAIAGLMVGVVGIFLPQVFGVGYDTIGRILNGESLGLFLLLGVMIAKLILTPVSIAGGFPGGVFAPSLFIGAALGGFFGQAANQLLPQMNLVPAAFAMVGMAAVLAGAVHAPLTAILLLFEMTRDYRIILPVMFSVVISLLISQRLQRDSVYTLGLARKGIRLERGRDVDVMESVLVDDVMLRDTFALPENFPVTALADQFLQTGRHGFAVINPDGSLNGIVSIEDYRRAQSGESGPFKQLSVGAIATHELVTVFPDDTVGVALRRMAPRDLSRLPVVSREDPTRLLGMVRRSDIVRAYEVALSRRAALRHRSQQSRLDAFTPETIKISEVPIHSNSFYVGRQMKDIAWPKECLVASLQRGRRVFIPHGDTILEAGDILVVVGEDSAQDAVRELAKKPLK